MKFLGVMDKIVLIGTLKVMGVATFLSVFASSTTYYMLYGIDEGFWPQFVFALLIPAFASFPIGVYFNAQNQKITNLNANLQQAHQIALDLNEKLAYEASHDIMTGVFNRAYFMEMIDVRKTLGKTDALIMVDADFFKTINDKFGHHNGDIALRIIADTLVENVQDMGTVARIGGEEFAVLLTETSLVDAKQIAETTRQKAEAAIFMPTPQTQHTITLSIGLAMLADMDRKHPLRKVDIALYEAKRTGRNKVVTYHPSMQADIAQPKPLIA